MPYICMLYQGCLFFLLQEHPKNTFNVAGTGGVVCQWLGVSYVFAAQLFIMCAGGAASPDQELQVPYDLPLTGYGREGTLGWCKLPGYA